MQAQTQKHKVDYSNYDTCRIIDVIPLDSSVTNDITDTPLLENDFSSMKFDDNINIEMIAVQGGIFQMGSTNDGLNQNYAFTAQVEDFFIGKYEVTQAQWEAIMGGNPSHNKGCANCPVESVSWNDIHLFIEILNKKTAKNYRLPTEKEWEYVARGGVKDSISIYAGSDNIDDIAVYKINAQSETKPVGSKKPNELGIYDMSGNVREFCSDWYKSYPGSSENINYTGTYRIDRGGSYLSSPKECNVACRFGGCEDSRYYHVGFRLAHSQ